MSIYKFYELKGMKQQDLNKLVLEKNNQSKEIDRLNNIINELKKENEFLKLNNPEQNMEYFRIIKENKRKIDNLRKENKELKEDNEVYKNLIDKKWEGN